MITLNNNRATENIAILKQFQKNREQGRLGHAFLFLGEEEKEQESMIEAVAKLLLCVSPVNNKACEQCRSCRWYADGYHPDYFSCGKDQENVSIERIRELHLFSQKTAHQHGYKIVTLYDVDQYSVYAVNALLKNVEEPSKNTVFLLRATNSQKIAATIKSRCVKIYGHALRVPLENSELKEALFWKNENISREDLLQKIVSESRETLYLFYYWVAEYCYYGMTRQSVYLSNPSEQPRYDELLNNLGVEKALIFLDEIKNTIKSIIIQGVNKELLWHSLIVQWRALCLEIFSHEHPCSR